MSETIKVGMADLNTCSSPDNLITYGLGSCVGVALWDSTTKIGGLLHLMLPSSVEIKNSHANVAKFADTGIDELISQMQRKGANRNRLKAKLAGGSTMFQVSGKENVMNVGTRNIAAAKTKLNELRIPIVSEDVGGNFGRTVTFYAENGEFHIKAVGKTNYII